MITSDPAEIGQADKVILPGVGRSKMRLPNFDGAI